MTAADLTALLSSLLTKRTSGNQPAMISLVGDTTLFRPHGRLPNGDANVALEALLGHQTHWRAVGRFSRVLEPLAGDSSAARSLSGWGGAVLPYLTVFACDWAARLARQMGARLSCSVARACVDSSFQDDYAACLADATRSFQVMGEITESLIGGLRTPPGRRQRSNAAAMVRLQPEARTTRVIWLTREGKELGRETLHQLAQRMSSEAKVADLLRRAEDLRSRRKAHRAAGDRKLKAVCPDLAEAVGQARKRRRHVGRRMCSKKVRGLPAEVYLFVGPGLDHHRYACANLVAHRAHEEFVLENRQKQHFYFPPVQLSAAVEFAPMNPPWHVPLPMVRMPARQPRWAHPYTGSLHADRFARADLRPAKRKEALTSISREARKIAPGLSQNILSESTAGCMCLGGQDSQTADLARQVRSAEAAGKEPNLLGLMEGLWDVIRVGLTRGHQENQGTPIADLSTVGMPYPIQSTAALAGTGLAARIFPYRRAKGAAKQ